MIAAAVGSGLGRWNDKLALYRVVMERVLAVQLASFQDSAEKAPAGAAGLHQLLDDYIEFYTDHPEFLALWQHRWLSDAVDLPDIEENYRLPLQALVHRTLQRPELANVDIAMMAGVFDWSVHGFVTGDLPADAEGVTYSAPAARTRFRSYMHLLLDEALARPRADS